jgi:hypothetical protein
MAEDKSTYGADIDVPFRFKRKPMPIAAELRPDWKMAALLLILQRSSHGGKSSLKRLHLLNWAVLSPRFRVEFEESRKDPLPLFGFNVRFEPAFSRAIDLAVGEGFVQWVDGDRLQITAKGIRWVSEIEKDESVMRAEREFFSKIGKSLTEKLAASMLKPGGAW